MHFQLQRTEFDLADEFIQLCLLKARCNGSSVRMLPEATEMVRQKRASRLLEPASIATWSDTLGPWLRYDSLQKAEFERDVRKATIPVGTTFDAQYASPLVALTTLIQAYFRSLVNVSMTDAIIARCMPVGPNVRVAVTTGTGTGNSAGEARWTPVTKLEFSAEQTAPSKALGLFVVSEDLLRMGGELATNFLSAEMSRAIVLATDIVTAGILVNGLSPISSTGGPRADLRKALEAIDLGQISRPMVFVSPQMLAQMATLGETGTTSHNGPPTFPDVQLPGGGTCAGMPVMGIDALASYAGAGSPASDCMVVVDAAQIAGSAGTMDLLASNDASLLMDTAPSVGSPENEPAAAQLVSMFQTDSVAFRGTRYFNIARARTTAVAVVSGCSYGL